MLSKILAGRAASERLAHFFRGALQDLADDHARPRRDSRSAVGHLAGIRSVDLDIFIGDAERVRDDLREHRARALADFRARDENPHAGFRQRERRFRGELHLARARETGPVKEERQADAAVRARQFSSSPVEICPLDGGPQHFAGAAVFAEFLSGRRRIARPERVLLAQRDRIELQLFGDPLHVDFGRKLRLRRAESAKRAVWRRVRHGRTAADADVVAAVGPGRVQHAA